MVIHLVSVIKATFRKNKLKGKRNEVRKRFIING